MKDLSIVIVNYNVQHFLDQCLQSVFESKHDLDIDVFVVDNNSIDGSVQMVRDKYPSVKLEANEDNVGFAVANNQAIKQSNSTYVLLLNPDTILSEDTLQLSFEKMESNLKIGGLGVKMMDGKGNFLPESKRGLPTFWSSFYKMSGLSKLFPTSKKFNAYHQGHLTKEKDHEIEVLSGAYMFLRKSVLDQIGLLDEQFFMYGEDIDLSYRINKSGHSNYYLSKTSIIHFKGESTRKASISYNKHFYNAMILFNNKHFQGKSGLLKWSINLLILLSGIIGFIRSNVAPLIYPLFDFGLIFGSFYLVKELWARYYFLNANYYDDIPTNLLFLGLTLVYSFVLFIAGFYDSNKGFANLIKSWFAGGILVFIVYNFLPEEYRFSRFIVLLSFLLIIILLWLSRKLFLRLRSPNGQLDSNKEKKLLLIGSLNSIESLKEQLINNQDGIESIICVSSDEEYDSSEFVGGIDNLNDIVSLENPSEIIFCSGDISNSRIFEIMSKTGKGFSYRISSNDNETIIGSDSKNSIGTWYTTKLNFNIDSTVMKRQKRLFDLIASLLVVVISPFILILSKSRWKILKNVFSVLINQKTWIGYLMPYNMTKLPPLKVSVFDHKVIDQTSDLTKTNAQLNLDYAQKYSVWKDSIAFLYKLMP